MPSKLVCLATLSFAVFGSPAFADAVKVVAAENFYGDMAAQIGGGHVAVTSILTNPDVDPHLFEASSETARERQEEPPRLDRAHFATAFGRAGDSGPARRSSDFALEEPQGAREKAASGGSDQAPPHRAWPSRTRRRFGRP